MSDLQRLTALGLHPGEWRGSGDVFPILHAGPIRQWSREADESYRQRAERTRRELYVGMTRARDGLWLGYLPQSTNHNQDHETTWRRAT